QPKHSPEATAFLTGVDPNDLREAARIYATGGNGAIYCGLGVTEHSQGSTTVIAIANLAMATGNIGAPGVGVNPLRGQNNVPGSSFLEKDGTFTNAERRSQRVRKVMTPKNGMADWEVTIGLARAMGFEMNYSHPSEIMDEIAALTPTFTGVSYAKLDELGSVQWPCNEKAPEGTPVMHIGGFVRGKGKFIVTEYIATDERTGPRFPLLLTTGRILSQYNVGAQTRRTENVVWHSED